MITKSLIAVIGSQRFTAAPPPVYEGQGAVTASTGTRTLYPNYPGTVNSGDLLVLIWTRNSGEGSDVPQDVGFTKLGEDDVNGNTGRKYAVYYKIASGSESGFVSCGQTSIAACGAQIYRFSNASTITITDTVDQTILINTDPTLTSVASPVADGLGRVTLIVGSNETNRNFTWPSPWTGLNSSSHGSNRIIAGVFDNALAELTTADIEMTNASIPGNDDQGYFICKIEP